QTGVDAALWIKKSFEDLAIKAGRSDTKTWLVETKGRYIQPSVVTVIGADLKTPAIIIGAHIDTLDKDNARMPGADDDASGSAVTLEIARILLESSQSLTHPIYIIWYAAEEKGLVGSRRVVEAFVHKKTPVEAVIQFDMTGFRPD